MSTRSDQFALAANGDFQNRCLASGMSYSIATVVGEGAVPNHADRLQLTQQVFLYPDAWKYRLALACVMQSSALQTAAPTNASAADSDINTAIAAIWTQLGLALTAAQTFKVI